jgi:hypothetical protein
VLASCGETHAALADIVPPNQFWRWKDMWSNSLRTSVFVASLVEYLRTRTLISLASTKEVLGSMFSLDDFIISPGNLTVLVKEEWNDRFSLSAEDYLHGLITLVNELVSDAHRL